MGREFLDIQYQSQFSEFTTLELDVLLFFSATKFSGKVLAFVPNRDIETVPDTTLYPLADPDTTAKKNPDPALKKYNRVQIQPDTIIQRITVLAEA